MPGGRPKRASGLACPKCGLDQTVKDGFQRFIQRWRCRTTYCLNRFQEEGSRRYGDQAIAFSDFHRIENSIQNGTKPDLRIFEIAERSGLNRRTVNKWRKEKWRPLVKREEWIFMRKFLKAPAQDLHHYLNRRGIVTESKESLNRSTRKNILSENWKALRKDAYAHSNPYPQRETMPLGSSDKNRFGSIHDWQKNKNFDKNPDIANSYPSEAFHIVQDIVNKHDNFLNRNPDLVSQLAYRQVEQRFIEQQLPKGLILAHNRFLGLSSQFCDELFLHVYSGTRAQLYLRLVEKLRRLHIRQLAVIWRKIQTKQNKLPSFTALQAKFIDKTNKRTETITALAESFKGSS